MYSDVHTPRPMADDLFGYVPHCSNQTDVSLTSASDLETNVKSKGEVKKHIIRLPVDYWTGFYLQLIYILYTYITIYTMNNIIQGNCRDLRANFNDFLLLCDNYDPNVCCLQETMLTKDYFIIRGFNCIHLTTRDIGGWACGGVSVLVRDDIPYSECTLNTTLQAKIVTIIIINKYHIFIKTLIVILHTT